jgi:hypothetical protein
MTRLVAGLFAAAACGLAPAQGPGLTFSFENKKWGEVIDWFRTESGLVYAGTVTPTGSVTIKPPAGKTYTIPQIVDLLNELLAPRYVLIRRGQTFTLLPYDDLIEPENVRRIADVSELDSLGKTELVQLVVPLGPLAVDDVVPAMQFLKSTFGKIGPFGATSLMVQDKALNVQLIVAAISRLAKSADTQERYSHPCRYVRATTAAELLTAILGPDAAAAEPTYAVGPTGRPVPVTPKGKALRVTAREQANVVLVTGPADKVDLARKVLRDDIDTGPPGSELPRGGEPSFHTYPVTPGTADTAAAALQARYKNTSVVVVPVGTDRIHVYGFPADHAAVARQVLANDPEARGEPVTEVVPVYDGDPKALAMRLTRMFPPVNGLPFIDEQTDGPTAGVLVRGTPEQVRRIRAEVRTVDPASGSDDSLASTRRTVRLAPGVSPSILAEVLSDFVTRTRPNEAIILDPTVPPEKPKAQPRAARRRVPPAERAHPMPPAGTPPDEVYPAGPAADRK